MTTNGAFPILASLLLATAATATATITSAHADDAAPVVVAVAAPAPAPAAAPAPVAANGAPQNADWSDLSHINGQLVKVGETNDYHLSYKRTNISTNPIGWIYGSYGVSVSYGVNNHVALRADVNYLSSYLDEDVTGMEVGVGVPLYFRRTYQGPFLEPGFISRRFESKDCGCLESESAGGSSSETSTTYGPQMLVGWHWTWDSGLNIAVAGGVGRNWGSQDEYNKIFPNGYLRFGYAF
ncbi:MAG TPA: DUF3575 domain-containing protein [Kofleriaceae bacterium]|nr:DUF3575 domain-containing protein [Kofleriaceae bacterium]